MHPTFLHNAGHIKIWAKSEKNSWRRKYSADAPSAKNILFCRMQICAAQIIMLGIASPRIDRKRVDCHTRMFKMESISQLLSRFTRYITCRFLHVCNLIPFVQTFNYLVIWVERKQKKRASRNIQDLAQLFLIILCLRITNKTITRIFYTRVGK